MNALELLLQPDTVGAQSQLQIDAAIEYARLQRVEQERDALAKFVEEVAYDTYDRVSGGIKDKARELLAAALGEQ